MSLLAVKLIVTPLMILAASLVGRRWGAAVGGWLVGLPLTSGPVAVFLAIEHGAGFAAEASAGSLAGVDRAGRFRPGLCARGAVGLAGRPRSAAPAPSRRAPLALQAGRLAPAILFALALGALVVTLRLLPRDFRAPAPAAAPWWEIPARMALVTALVVAVTSVRLAARRAGQRRRRDLSADRRRARRLRPSRARAPRRRRGSQGHGERACSPSRFSFSSSAWRFRAPESSSPSPPRRSRRCSCKPRR